MRAEGLQFLLMAKEHQVRGEEASALKMYRLALPFFPGNEKLVRKVAALQDSIAAKRAERGSPVPVLKATTTYDVEPQLVHESVANIRRKQKVEDDDSFHQDENQPPPDDDDDDFIYRPRTKIRPMNKISKQITRPATMPAIASQQAVKHSTPLEDLEDEVGDSEDELSSALTANQTPRTRHLLAIINTKDVSQIKLLKGVGAKRAEAIVNCLCELEDEAQVTNLGQLGKLKGVGVKTVENMRSGVVV